MTVMDEIRRLPPLHATLALVALGFEPIQAARLVALRRRLAPDALDERAPGRRRRSASGSPAGWSRTAG